MRFRKKKWIITLLTMALVFSAIPFQAAAETPADANGKESAEGVVLTEQGPEKEPGQTQADSEDGDEKDGTSSAEENSSAQKNTVKNPQNSKKPQNGQKLRYVKWQKAPSWLASRASIPEPPELGDGQTQEGIFGESDVPMTEEEHLQLQQMSSQAVVSEDPSKRIDEEQLGLLTFIYINGAAYQGGDLQVNEGDNFSYMFSWAPKIKQEDKFTWGDGSWFEKTLFKVPGLNLMQNPPKTSVLIDGIKVGEQKLTYDPNTGEMKYRIIFNQYIQFFDPDTILAYLQGSGKFNKELSDGKIESGDKTGTLTVVKPENPGGQEQTPGGTGWSPAKPPDFGNKQFAFGKGVKWESSSLPYMEPQIDWRVVFLEYLQKVQQKFLKGEKPSSFVSDKNCIITETLDENQEFYIPEGDGDKARFGTAPFHIELPVLAAGTDKVLNGSVGSYEVNGSYDGPGEIKPYISVRSADGKDLHGFRKIDESDISNDIKGTSEQNGAIQKKVKETPLSWCITTDPKTRQQRLLINLGKLGTASDDSENKGINWSMANDQSVPETLLAKLINECDQKIKNIEDGIDSPIALLDARRLAVHTRLSAAINLPANAGKKEQLQKALLLWEADYKRWREDDKIQRLAPLEDEEGNLYVQLPALSFLDAFKEVAIDGKSTPFKNTAEYKNFEKSLSNLRGDQKTYLANRLNYQKDWESVKKIYENTKEFYREGRVFGFTLKVRSKSVNTSKQTYKNNVKIEFDNYTFSAEDSADVRFSTGIIGNYALGSLVMQKADALYEPSGENDVPVIQQIEKDKNGLAGAVFKVYCGSFKEPVVPEKTEDNLAHFLPKDASENEDTYRYSHNGSDGGDSHITGEVTELVTDQNGKLVLSHIPSQHPHYLTEVEAPAGYYLNEAMIPISSKNDDITYKLLPNVSRSVSLVKTDAYSNQPVADAEFKLYRKEADGTETEVTGFTKKTVNGHTGYWVSKNGNAGLLTDGEGKLCIHGLEAGNYVIREIGAPAYKVPQQKPEKEFTLEKTYEAAVKAGPDEGSSLDEEGHMVLWSKDKPLTNEPKTAGLTLRKKDGTSKEPLAGAGFTLFRFTGTESEWKQNPDDPTKWQAVELNQENEKYFKTSQDVKEVILPGLPSGLKVTLDAAISGATGEVTITDIPVGHYSIAETKVPERADSEEPYVRDYHSYYFDVNANTIEEAEKNGTLQVKNGLGDSAQTVDDNAIYNYTKLMKLKLIKYDSTDGEQKLPDENLISGGDGESWYYDTADSVSAKGIGGVKYKLFMQVGVGVNPSPGEVNSPDLLTNPTNPEPGYDTCLAVGETDNNGVLDITDFKDREGKPLEALNMEEYYLIEVAAPEGYLLDRTPIRFSLDGNAVPENGTPGIVKLAGNKQYEYGVQLVKKAEGENGKPLAGAEFTIREKDGQPLSVKETAPGVYRADETGGSTILKTGSDGMFKVTGLKKGTEYIFTETRAPQGYQKPDEGISVTTPESVDDNNENVLQEENLLLSKVTAENKPLLGAMELYKIDDEEQKPLAGAKFQLYKTVMEPLPQDHPEFDPQDPGALHTVDKKVEDGLKTTDEDGKIVYENLEWGSYVVREVEAPEGYATDEKRLTFVIDEDSFDEQGTPIKIIFSPVRNTKGDLGEAELIKVDAQDPDEKLSGAHFFLEKQLKNGSWIAYGKGIYITGDDGKIHFKLPLGKYRVTEMKAPDGYLLPEGEDLMKPVEFEITKDNIEKNPAKLTIANRKGATGLALRKTVSVQDTATGDDNMTDIPIQGVKFEFYRGNDQESKAPLRFEEQKDGMYQYAENGKVTQIPTDVDGEIHLLFPETFASDGSEIDFDKMIFCKEVSAPDNVVVDDGLKLIADGLVMNQWTVGKLGNYLTEEALAQCKVTVVKTDGKSKLALPGAEFQLYEAVKLGDEHLDIPVGDPQATDQNGNITFTGLKPGSTYHIAETKSPQGYVLDSTHHEVVLDKSAFDDQLNFKEVTINCANYHVKGSVTLKKTDSYNKENLSGAEFELFRHNDSVEGEKVYEHYGEYRYITDENGEIRLDLPIGKYYWIERAAPLGYDLGDSKPISFEITEKNAEQGVTVDAENTPVPGEKGSVKVIKTSEDGSRPLAGAEFLLYRLAETGTYELCHTQRHVTGDDGTFCLENLPAGTYAVKEVKAPQGYDIISPDRLYPFTVSSEKPAVEISVRNFKAEGTLQVSKEVTGAGDKNKAFGFSVTLEDRGVSGTFGEMEFSNGVSRFTLKHGETKTASGLPLGMKYTVEEYDNEGYTVTAENASGLISENTPPVKYINYMSGGSIIDPNPPVDPDKPDKPDKPDPEEPDNPDKPDRPDSEKPDKPDHQGTGGGSHGGAQGNQNPQQNQTSGAPATGDRSMLPFWGLVFLLSCGGAAAGIYRRRRESQEEKQK